MQNIRPIGMRMSKSMAASYQKMTLRTTASASTSDAQRAGPRYQGMPSWSVSRGVSE